MKLNMYMRLATAISIALSFICCKGQKEVANNVGGLGLLTTNTQHPIPLYKSEADDQPFDILRFEVAKSGVTQFRTKISLKPYLLNQGDSYEDGKRHIEMGLVRFGAELKFRVVDTGASFFKIVTDEEKQETCIIKKDKKGAYYSSEQELTNNSCSNCPGSKYNPSWYIFETWDRFLQRVEFITKEKLIIYDAPNGKVLFENKDNSFLPFQVTAVKDDWIKLKKGFGREFNFDSTKNYDGWTQWRQGEKQLIEIVDALMSKQ